MQLKHRISIIIMLAALIISATNIPMLSTTAYAAVDIPDDNLRDALVSLTGAASANDLTTGLLAGLSGSVNLSNRGISTLDGIQHLVNITELNLSKNPIYKQSEVARLAQLTNLRKLDISALSLSQIPRQIGSMAWLKELNISANRLTELPSSFDSLNLDTLYAHYCYFDLTNDPTTVARLQGAAASSQYEYQLAGITNFQAICSQPGTVILTWDDMPDITFANGVTAKVQRYSVTQPDPSGQQGSWLAQTSPGSPTYTHTGLDPATEYSFDISVDYYITGTPYDGKYIKKYEKILMKPVPQATPTPTATPDATPTPTPEVSTTPTPQPTTAATVRPVVTAAPVYTLPPMDNSQAINPMTILLIIIGALVGLILILVMILASRARGSRGRSSSSQRRR